MAELEESKALDLSGLEHYNQKLNDEKIGNITNLGGGKTDLGTEASVDELDIANSIRLNSTSVGDDYCRIGSRNPGEFAFDAIKSGSTLTAYLRLTQPNDVIATETYVDNKTWDASDITSGTLSWERLPTVPLSKGGTGVSMSSAPLLLVNLASTSAASPLSATPRPGVTGVLPASHGGTGVSNLKDLIKFDYTASTKTLNITVDESLLGA